MHFQQEQQLPPLIPIKKKKDLLQTPYIPQSEQKSKLQSTQAKTQNRHEQLQQAKQSQPVLTNRNRMPELQKQKSQKQVQQKKIQSFSQKFKNIQEKSATTKKSTKKSEQEKKQENEKSKFLIAEMLNKISVKNISEELYPITNETIENVIFQMEEEIKSYKLQAQKKQNTLITNPNNQHLKAEIATLQKSIDHCQTIKQLYHQKINFRNKIAILQGKIIELRAENRDLKIKVSRGIQKIQNHMHNLPCQKEKELREELNKCTSELKKEKQMRQSLENNIQDIIMNFKRLYQEADTARLIVTKKLRQIEDRQKRLNQAKLQFLADATDQQASNSIKKSPKLQYLDEKKNPKPSSSHVHQSENSTQRYRQNQPRPQKDERQRERVSRQIGKNAIPVDKKQERKPMSFEENIRKMRGNQSMFSQIYNRG